MLLSFLFGSTPGESAFDACDVMHGTVEVLRLA
jgi:hypothetical protein